VEDCEISLKLNPKNAKAAYRGISYDDYDEPSLNNCTFLYSPDSLLKDGAVATGFINFQIIE
jgi:hypothetical protein